jgi:Cys-tRNA synthase (O-phospho-L-seryl-tRNA:Cys-tRNA synthase)
MSRFWRKETYVQQLDTELHPRDGLHTNRIEELAASDPTRDYFLYNALAGRVIRQIKRRSADSEGEQRRGPDSKTG